ncbi:MULTISPECIES: sn-glycerol-3-phosphate ABC transporter ATP-binding protein UgpC [unclassified Herbaspirillum]|uniref:ABC transporter ATP-binding protein n=1 Tax=unclassified Herbaspirillum TaxID=2624150 RepID=UPI000E2F498E|nr:MULTISPECIES: sn-glycerol-3-phosphate ABC transporter ATP-binding protein UgpC [unclassified Herbaspirillum]RFB73220.1 sn-glycerol-3-phosphate ABC transporter ATP-binding protein UgpC [Herbaspirillum sp. 3R-3a1]TFI10969.1 sn-glycerol-3-phosphate ABC transporter ATP-binding protein UgpC [Herbaspirillum sp. 3R11]TFI16876.1 sn-glycerol-3-phosphate ABC transporter ATP-binding protein UgpC [Herbaspirillum sp. 3R-11]TFI30523.1 sn-glycerol-3-phosphate ABC transporter ATP-binding protein UgpC [Herba
MANVSIKDLKKSYDGKQNVLAGLNLDIRDGEFCVLVGPSGCGKSTLLRMLCGLEDISGGELAIGGDIVNHLPPAKRGIAMVFQSYALYPHMNVYKNMAFGLKIAGSNKADIDERIRHAAGILKIDHLLERLPRELSGGQRQRVAIGRAIVRKPRLFLFDEPLSNLDAALRVQTRLEIAKLHKQLAATIVYVTHDQVEAMTLGDKIVVMHDGHIQQAGTPLELYQHPQNLFVAGFIGSPKMNFLPGLVTAVAEDGLEVAVTGGRKVRVDVVPGNAKVGEKVTLGLRAEHIHENTGGSEQFSGQVNLVEHLGEANFIYITLSGGQDIVVRGDGNRNVDIGEEIVLSANSNAFHVFDADGNALRRLKPGNLVSSRHH